MDYAGLGPFMVLVDAVVVVVLIAGLLVARRPWNEAIDAVGSNPPGLALTMQEARRRVGRRAGMIATGVLVVLVVVALIVTQVLVLRVEPRADTLVMFALLALLSFPGGLALPLLVMIPILISRMAGTRAGRKVLVEAVQAGSVGPHGADALRGLSSGWSRGGVISFGLMAAIASLCFGGALVALMFAAATATVTCARDPKCM